MNTKNQRGFSAWLLLPWLLFFVLAFIFWWFVYERGGGQTITPANIDHSSAIVRSEPASVPTIATMPVISYSDAVKKAAVSVVNIYTTQKINHPYANDPLFREFLEFHGYNIPDNSGTNLGSGVIVSNEGYIITNAHVIDKADEIIVVLHDGRKAKAKIIGADKESDLAVIKITLDNLTPINFKIALVEVGDVALAIGNPFGVGQTVTQGIVSATGRTGLGMNTYEDFIQTDAAINPGNSGGALVDAYGDLIGINTMIYSRSGGSMGIGFAINIAVVQKVMNDIIATGLVHRGWLGIEVGRQMDNPISLEVQKGVIVAKVIPNAPAAAAGIVEGDVILAIDGVAVNNANSLIQTIAKKSPKTNTTLSIKRGDGYFEAVVTLAERPLLIQ